MKTIKVKQLNKADFEAYGSYSNLIDVKEPITGNTLIFTPDLVQQSLTPGCNMESFSCCVAKKRPYVIEQIEYHNTTSEGILPLNGDVIIHVALAFADKKKALDVMEAYYVPMGTIVVLKAGVWHHAPYPAGEDVSTLILLPPRIYENDCICIDLEDDEKIAFEL